VPLGHLAPSGRKAPGQARRAVLTLFLQDVRLRDRPRGHHHQNLYGGLLLLHHHLHLHTGRPRGLVLPGAFGRKPPTTVVVRPQPLPLAGVRRSLKV